MCSHLRRKSFFEQGFILLSMGILLSLSARPAPAVAPLIYPHKPNTLEFPAQRAKFVRVIMHASSSGQPCIDELEVYAVEGPKNLALAEQGAEASASSCLTGYSSHAIKHLNDGRYGNEYSWIAAQATGEWAQIELPEAARIARVVFSRDRTQRYADRVPTDVEVQLSLDGKDWKTAGRLQGRAADVKVRPKSGGFAGFVPGAPPAPRAGRESSTLSNSAASEDDAGFANLALIPNAAPLASSALSGHAIHNVKHLNDGLVGNKQSWVAETDPAWAEIDLGDVYWVYHVAFGSDALRDFRDRAATKFSILTATKYDSQTTSSTWNTVHTQAGGSPVETRKSFKFQPVRARWVRIAVEATNGNSVRIDEIEIFGRKDAIPLEAIGPLPQAPQIDDRLAKTESQYTDQLRGAFLAEEHAWLKTYGRADLSSRLVPYNGRVKEYPRHVADDALPLPPLTNAPALDGRLDDSCWEQASRGVVRVARPDEFEFGPLVETSVRAARDDGSLFLAIETGRLLSTHVAVLSGSDGSGLGVLALESGKLVFRTYSADGSLDESIPVEGGVNESLTQFEARLPLDQFPDCPTLGLRVGLGMGGKHTKPQGRAVNFVFSSLSISEVGDCIAGTFRVRLSVAPTGEAVTLTTNASGLKAPLTLAPGESREFAIPGTGPIGPEFTFDVSTDDGETYALHLFRYDPLQRPLELMQAMLERFASAGRDVALEREQLSKFRELQATLQAVKIPDGAAERGAFFDLRLAKRRLLLREPDLEPIETLLFVKRHAFEPSHNYSVLLDSRYRPGGGVCTLHIPRHDGRFEPAEALLTTLFDSGGGIARNAAADFGLDKIYFAHRPSADENFHIMEMAPDGNNLKQITDGPFHDYWPCPLPDGGLAYITTRCRARFLCWRPQAAVLFRMDADGSNSRPLSFANLTEWGPSVMSDGRIIWQRSEYLDKGADFGHTLWAVRPDGTKPELVFGNDIIQPNGYANGREVPGTSEFLCTLVSHFGDLNGPLALVDPARGRSNPQAITSLTPEVPWPGNWPKEECFRDPFPLARDYFLCAHAPRGQFGLYVLDRFGNRELLYLDEAIGSMCPTPLRVQPRPPVLSTKIALGKPQGELIISDVYQGIARQVPRGTVKYIRVCQEVRADLEQLPSGRLRHDHPDFREWYATPIHKVSGPYGWPSFVAKASLGIVPVEKDGSARFHAPAGKVIYFEALDKDFNELQRMRSVVQLQPGETRSCIGCHEKRNSAPPARMPIALSRPPRELEPPPWGAGAFSYEKVVQPVWNKHCVECHNTKDQPKLDFTATLDAHRVPASYRTLISQGWVHYLDCGWNSGGTEKREALTFGTLKSKLWGVLDTGHYDVELTVEEKRRVKCWTDLNCPLWPDYLHRDARPVVAPTLTTGVGKRGK